MEVIFGERYRLKDLIGSGCFGDIYSGKDDVTSERVAIKLEHANTHTPQLLWEAQIYETLKDLVYIPRMYWHGEGLGYKVLVTQLLGSNLEELFMKCNGKFSLKTVLMLADQMLRAIELLHRKKFVHRDIKPDNFMFGVGAHETDLYLIDFGLVRMLCCDDTEFQAPFRQVSMVGTARYASINAMRGEIQSRRDDLESLGYIFVYFLNGRLPWQDLSAPDLTRRCAQILKVKEELTPEMLCKGLPHEFEIYLRSVQELTYDEEPNYAFYRALFKTLSLKRGYVFDALYDWFLLENETNPHRTHNYKLITPLDSKIGKFQRNSMKMARSIIKPASFSSTRSRMKGHRQTFSFSFK